MKIQDRAFAERRCVAFERSGKASRRRAAPPRPPLGRARVARASPSLVGPRRRSRPPRSPAGARRSAAPLGVDAGGPRGSSSRARLTPRARAAAAPARRGLRAGAGAVRVSSATSKAAAAGPRGARGGGRAASRPLARPWVRRLGFKASSRCAPGRSAEKRRAPRVGWSAPRRPRRARGRARRLGRRCAPPRKAWSTTDTSMSLFRRDLLQHFARFTGEHYRLPQTRSDARTPPQTRVPPRRHWRDLAKVPPPWRAEANPARRGGIAWPAASAREAQAGQALHRRRGRPVVLPASEEIAQERARRLDPANERDETSRKGSFLAPCSAAPILEVL